MSWLGFGSSSSTFSNILQETVLVENKLPGRTKIHLWQVESRYDTGFIYLNNDGCLHYRYLLEGQVLASFKTQAPALLVCLKLEA